MPNNYLKKYLTVQENLIRNIKVNSIVNIYKSLAKTSKKPVFTSDLLMIKIAPIVMTALLLNPLTASSGVRIPTIKSTPIAPKAVTSNGIHSRTNITVAMDKTASSIKISKEIRNPQLIKIELSI